MPSPLVCTACLPLRQQPPLPLHVEECGSPARMRGAAAPRRRRSTPPGAGTLGNSGRACAVALQALPLKPSATATIHSARCSLVTHYDGPPSGTSRTKTAPGEGYCRYRPPPSPTARRARRRTARAARKVVSRAVPAPSAARARAPPGLGAPGLAAAGYRGGGGGLQSGSGFSSALLVSSAPSRRTLSCGRLTKINFIVPQPHLRRGARPQDALRRRQGRRRRRVAVPLLRAPRRRGGSHDVW